MTTSICCKAARPRSISGSVGRGSESGPAKNEGRLIREINMRAVQLIAYGDPLEGLKCVDIPEPEAPGSNQVLIGSSFLRSTRATSCSHGASTECAPLFQPSSAMKVLAAFSP